MKDAAATEFPGAGLVLVFAALCWFFRGTLRALAFF